MNVIGIIAEYNPFHNGHAYQIAHVRKNLHADYIVVATSGDYVQRGEPALLDKYTRARMALSSGADVVLELPVLWSTASAELFADAGISLFEKMGCVNGICFGAESGDLALLRRIADVLADEPADLKASLKHNLNPAVHSQRQGKLPCSRIFPAPPVRMVPCPYPQRRSPPCLPPRTTYWLWNT